MPALLQGNAGDVADPDPIGRRRREIMRQQVLSDRQIVFAVGRDDDDLLQRALMPRVCINRCTGALPTQ